MEKLRELRQARHLSQVELGRRARLPSQLISAIEGGWQKPRQIQAKRLASALGVSLEELEDNVSQ